MSFSGCLEGLVGFSGSLVSFSGCLEGLVGFSGSLVSFSGCLEGLAGFSGCLFFWWLLSFLGRGLVVV